MFLQVIAEDYDFQTKTERHVEKQIPVDSIASIIQTRDGKKCFVVIKEEHRADMGLGKCPMFGDPEEGFILTSSFDELRARNQELFMSSPVFFQFTRRDYERSVYNDTQIFFPTVAIEDITEDEGRKSCFILIKEDHRLWCGLDTSHGYEGFTTPNSLAVLQAKNPNFPFSVRPNSSGQEIIHLDAAPT